MRSMAVSWKTAGAILVVAFALRVMAGYVWQNRLEPGVRFTFGDSESYWRLAQTIARWQPYEYGDGMRLFRMPGYPLALAGLFRLLGDDDPPVLFVRLFGAALGTVTIGCVMLLSRQLFDRRAALVAGGMAAIYPGAIIMSVLVLSEVLFCPLMLLHLSCWIAAGRSTAFRGWFSLSLAAGAMSGLATLARPSWLLFSPCVFLGLLIVTRFDLRHLRTGLVMLIAMACSLAPWWVRGYCITGRFVLTTLQVGASLYDGLNPTANGSSDMQFVAGFLREQVRADSEERLGGEATFEYRLDERMRRAAQQWVWQHPRRAVELVGIKFMRMWSPWPNAADMQSWFIRLVILFSYVPVMILGFWGLLVNWRRGWIYWMCVLPGAYFTCLHVVFVSSIRYREPAMLPWIALGACVLAHCFQRVPIISRAIDV